MNTELLCGKETVKLTLPDSVTQLDIKPLAARVRKACELKFCEGLNLAKERNLCQ